MGEKYNCIDGGSDYCPCNLANTMDCISCSLLRGEEFCDCKWNGVCILYEYEMNNNKPNKLRKSYNGIVEGKEILDENLFLLKISLDKELLHELGEIGSYVFIKKIENEFYYEAPMSIFYIDNKHIYIVYQEIGSKTKNIKNGDRLSVRGPYWNGIIGNKPLSSIRDANILIIARGIGQSAILRPLNNLVEKDNKVTLFLDKGKLNDLYCLKFINKNIKTDNLDLFSKEGKEKLTEYILNNPIDIILSSGSDMVHRNISSIIKNTKEEIILYTSNNNILCCGEGICGSCIRKISSGDRIKTCKTLIDPKSIY